MSTRYAQFLLIFLAGWSSYRDQGHCSSHQVPLYRGRVDFWPDHLCKWRLHHSLSWNQVVRKYLEQQIFLKTFMVSFILPLPCQDVPAGVLGMRELAVDSEAFAASSDAVSLTSMRHMRERLQETCLEASRLQRHHTSTHVLSGSPTLMSCPSIAPHT